MPSLGEAPARRARPSASRVSAGPSSSGKTTTTHKLAERLEREGVHVIPMSLDNYFFDLELHPKDEFGDYDFETPEAMDLALINRHPSEPLDWVVAFKGTPLSGTFQATVLAGDSPDAYNDVDSPDRVAPLQQVLEFQEGATKLPPHSLTVLQVPMS